jgi:hypothetical protein
LRFAARSCLTATAVSACRFLLKLAAEHTRTTSAKITTAAAVEACAIRQTPLQEHANAAQLPGTDLLLVLHCKAQLRLHITIIYYHNITLFVPDSFLRSQLALSSLASCQQQVPAELTEE